MTRIRLAHIVRHPVKSVGWQEIERAALTRGRPLPFDRLWAVATEAAETQAELDVWQPKLRFVRGAAEGRLQAVRATFDERTQAITLSHPDRETFTGVLPQAASALLEWLRPLWPDTRPAPSRLVSRSDGGALTDVPEPYVSLLNLSSNTALATKMGLDLSIHRWRGNLWLDGLPPWEEFNWIGREIQIGSARLKIEKRITRCVATTFDPISGIRQGETLDALTQGWGHQDFGVYGRVIATGEIAIEDEVIVFP